MSTELRGASALITGAGGGIGSATTALRMYRLRRYTPDRVARRIVAAVRPTTP